MKKLLMLALLAVTFSVGAQDVDTSVYTDYDPNPHYVQAPYAVRRARAKALARRGLATEPTLPDHINNAEQKYFPPVFNQDGGSCGSAQSIGYDFTYEMDCYRDLDASLPENQYPTHFTWLLTYHNSGKDEMARANGVPNVPTYGGRTYSRLFGNQTHDDDDFGWMQGYDKWYSAMFNRAIGTFAMTAPTNTPEGRQELKEYFYNHCGDESLPAGGIVGIGCAAYGTWAKIPSTAANKAAGVNGMSYIKAWGDTYNHAITVCGYDDRIEFDLDGDGKIGEVDEDEVGAWIICNSWGDGWENNGFIYCPYKYSYSVLTDQMAWTPTSHIIRRDYRPLRTLRIRMDYSHRSELKLGAGVSENLNATSPESTIEFEHFKFAGNHSNLTKAPEVPMLGRWADGLHYEPMEFGYDLTDLTATVDRTKPLKYFFIIESKSNAGGSGTVYDCTLVNYEFDMDGVEIPFDMDGNVSILNKGKKTIITVVVPGEQIFPPRNLSLTDGILFWDAPQSSSLPLSSYYIYEGGELIDSVSATTCTYDPVVTTGAPFTVKAVYTSGGLHHISEATNSVAPLPEPSADNHIIEFVGGGMVVPNAIDEPLSQATIEFWMRSDKHISYNQQFGPGWGTFLFHTDNNGNLVVGWNTGSNERTSVSGIFSLNESWNHIAITINKNVMSIYVNGVRKGNFTCNTYSGLTAFGDLKFGHSGDNQQWTGAIDELRVWKTVRTVNEIKAGMRTEIANPAAQKDLMLYLRMDPIEVGGKTCLEELVAGKHARLLTMGEAKTANNNSLLTGSTTDFSASITGDKSGVVGIPVSFKAVTPVDAVSWQWHAEGADVTDVNAFAPVLTYSKAGTYEVTLTATSLDGTVATSSATVTITDATAPVAAFDIASESVPAGDHFSFINRSTGDACTYEWSMPGALVEHVTGVNATALYPTLGTFSVTLTVTNSVGSSSVTRDVTVTAAAPKALFDLSSDAILLGDTLTLIDASRYEPTSWQWELHNGHRAFMVSGPMLNVCPSAPGIYTITLTAGNTLGSGTLTKGNILTVSNADAKTALHFTGSESITLASPIEKSVEGFTVDFWMRPSTLQNFDLMTTDGATVTLSAAEDGSVSFAHSSRSATSGLQYLIAGEWHHYAVVFDKGRVRFYRDGLSFAEPPTTIGSQTLSAVTGDAQLFKGFSGLVDELRIWTSALTHDNICTYANVPIADIADVESALGLCTYYDFNQSGGDVIDRTSCGRTGHRVNFGPDGDAWNSALGVFTLDLEVGPAGDISAQYLTNYQRPYRTGSGSVNSNNSSRFRRLAMGTSQSAWQEAGAIKKGTIITGAHVDTEHDNDITIETKWSGFEETLSDYRLWQTVMLPAGRYTFSSELSDGTDAQGSFLVACEGTEMLTNATYADQAIAWCSLTDPSITFTLEKATQVSLGIIVNMSGQLCLSFKYFHLEGMTFDNLQVIYDSEALNSLINCLSELTSDGHDYSRAIYDATTTEAWFEALRAARVYATTQSGTDEEYAAAEAALREAYAAIRLREVITDGLYFIDNASSASLFVKGLYAFNDTLPAWNNADRTNPRFLWKVEVVGQDANGCQLRLQNVESGLAFGTVVEGATATLQQEGAIFVANLVADNTLTLRTAEGFDLTPASFNDGLSTGGLISVAKPTDKAEDANAWRFIPATVDALAVLDGTRAAIAAAAKASDETPFTDKGPLLTDAAQVSTNRPTIGRTSFSVLFDGKTTSYMTRNTALTEEEILTAEAPYLEFILPYALDRLWIVTSAYSTSKTSFRPMRMHVSVPEGEGDDAVWTKVATFWNIPIAYPQGLKVDEPVTDWRSPLVTLPAPAQRIRLVVDEVNYRTHTSTSDNNLFNDFAFSELQLFDANGNVGINVLEADTAHDALYTPDGRQVTIDATHLAPGIYIRRGAKVVVR